ncbi:hypothetical protein KCU77_g7361, partial [Aureobasidium melanogenum]
MQFTSLAILAAAFGIAAAQSSTTAATTTSSCAAQTVLDLCVSQQSARNSQCAATDYDCLCTGYSNLV